MNNLDRLFDSEECEALRSARDILQRGAARLRQRVAAVPTERGARASENARQAREAITSLLMVQLGTLGHEQAVAVLFDAQGRMIAIEDFPQGELTSCTMPARMLAGFVTRHDAAMVLLAHNHPSGACAPSRPDERMHAQLTDWLRPMQCELIDSLVLTVDDWCSIGGNWTC
jgi:DNA repair protein RadC